jgi:hypothetical protein
MAQKRVSEYWSMTTNELKAEIRSINHIIHRLSMSGRKRDLVLRLIHYDRTYRNIHVIFDQGFTLSEEDKKFGIVSNLPLEFQDKVCQEIAHVFTYHFGSIYQRISPDGKQDDQIDRESSQNARREFTALITNMMVSWIVEDENLMYETLLYTGNHNVVHMSHRDNWTWTPDEKGRNFGDILVNIMCEMWDKSIQKYKNERRMYGNFQWGFSPPNIAERMRGLVQEKRDQVILQNTIRSTFLYGCATRNSGSETLPLIGARHIYAPVRRQIAQYAGAVNA